jgi:Leucine-rich repeat (LRR) protein
MKNLISARISKNKLTNIDEIVEDAVYLRELVADHNMMKTLPPIGHLRNLLRLDVSNNQLTYINEDVCQLETLTNLNLSCNMLTCLPSCFGTYLRNLVLLILSNNQLETIPSLSNCASLTSLYINDNRLTALPEGIDTLTQLEVINASGNELTYLPENIGQLTNIRELKLSRNKLSSLPASFVGLSGLIYLELNYNEFTNIPDEIHALPLLFTAYMNNNKIRNAASPAMANSHLRRIYLDYNTIMEISDELCSMKKLRELSMNNNAIARISPKIADITRLERLYLNWNYLTSLPPEIGCNIHLGQLHLSNNQLTSIPSTIGQLENTTTLNLENNRLTDLPPTIIGMEWLDTLNISGNPIVRLCPAVEQFMRAIEREEYPGGIAFEIHSAFSKIDEDAYIREMTVIMPDVKYTYMSNSDLNIYILNVLGEENGGNDERQSQLGMIYDKALRQIDYMSAHKAMIFYSLEYMKKQRKEFRESYVHNFIYDSLNAYNGANPMSCPRGVIERLVTSLIPSLVAHKDVCKGAEELLQVLVPRRTVSDILADISKDCYERCGGEEAQFRALLVEGAAGATAAEIDEFVRLLGLF